MVNKYSAGSSYYVQHHGVKSERQALKDMEFLKNWPRDGRLSKQDGKLIAKYDLFDTSNFQVGKGQPVYTQAEKNAAAKIRKEGNFTPAGLKMFNHVIHSLSAQISNANR